MVERLPEGLSEYPCHEIEQGYLCTQPTVRIRKWDDVYILTVKEQNLKLGRINSLSTQGVPPIVNREEEFELSADAYASLRGKCEGRIISKTRYVIDLRRMMQDGLYGGYKAELDIFHGAHEGLRLVEVEFPDVDTANSFVAPDWFGADVSNDPHYRNSYLSQC